MTDCRMRVLCLSCFALLLSGCNDSSPPRDQLQAARPDDQWRGDVDRLFSTGDYESAVPLLRQRVQKEPESGRDWFRLGYALHAVGQLDEAIEAHTRAAELDENERPLALYNLGCALALKGQREESLDALARAIAAGFNKKKTMAEDTDLDSLRRDPKFVELLRSIVPADGSVPASEHRDLDFWLGDWDVQTAGGRRLGSVTITATENGFLVHENWRGREHSRGSSINYFDPAKRAWTQTIVTGEGTVYRSTGTLTDKGIRFEGEFITQSGSRGMFRNELSREDGDKSIRQRMQKSTDGGKTWTTIFDGHYAPRKPRLSI